MPLAFHTDRDAMFRQQEINSDKHVVPFIESVIELNNRTVLEIGCGEGGVLKPFIDRGAICYGIDINASKIQHATETFCQEISDKKANFVVRDIYNPKIIKEYKDQFDVILLMNTIEHIPDSQKLMNVMKHILKPDGLVFIAFPPWFMPYGGHQQMAESRWAKLPYYHLLPKRLYKSLLSLFGESDIKIRNLMSIVATKMTIQGFERLVNASKFRIVKKRFYLINPIYEVKFGLNAIRQLPFLRSIPWLRDIFTTTCYYIIQPDKINLDI